MSFLTINNIDLLNKRVMIRLDLNVPICNGVIKSSKRIDASLTTIKYAIDKGAIVILVSHLGRPIEGIYDKKYSLLPIVKYLEKKLHISIEFITDYLTKKIFFSKYKNKVFMLENVRFNIGEKKNDEYLSKKYSSMCDIFVMDAFATAHRMHSSTYGVINFSPISCIGFLFNSEINALSNIISNPVRPLVSIVGGAKISTKFNILNYLGSISDNLIVGGGISNTFISINNNVGKSLCEPSYVYKAKKLLSKYNIFIPIDCRVGKIFSKNAKSYLRNVNNISDNEEIMDFGDKTISLMSNILKNAKTILWNGPVGVFEFINFREGTKSITNIIKNNKFFTVIGGGDTISAVEYFGISDKISYISTGGGSFLKFLEGKDLPVISILKEKAILF